MPSAYSKTHTLVDVAKVRKLDKARMGEGHYLAAPTVGWIYQMHENLKARYAYRDEIIRLFVSMFRLESPFVGNKMDQADKVVVTDKSNRVRHTVAPLPFDMLTLGLSMASDRHPYTNVHPMHKSHTQARMDECDRFAQALIDMRTGRSDLMGEMGVQTMVTGWLPTLHYFDPRMIYEGQYPFDYQVLSPLNVYPLLNSRKQAILATVEYEVTGAQLAEEFSCYPGVAELFEAEMEYPADSPADMEHRQPFNNIYDTRFRLIRYYDDTYTALLLGVNGEVTQAALGNNPLLKKLKENSEHGKYASVLHSSDLATDNPYAGIEAHNLGLMPIHIEGCWADPMGPGTLDPANSASLDIPGYNSIVYYPFFYSLRPTWIDLSRLRSMQHTMVNRLLETPLIAKTDNVERLMAYKDTGVIPLEPGSDEDAKYLAPPPGLDSSFQFVISEIKEDIQKGAYANASSGMRVGSSGRQQDVATQQSTIRNEIIYKVMSRSTAHYPMAVIKTMMHRGEDGASEDLFVAGLGTKYGDGSGYTMDYNVKELSGVCPLVTVDMLTKEPFKDPANVATFNSLASTDKFADEDLMRMFGVVNPARYVTAKKVETVEREKGVIGPEVEIAQLEAQLKYKKEKWKLQTKVDLLEDQLQHQAARQEIEQKMRELPIDKQVAAYQASLAKIQEEAMGQAGIGGQPPQGPGGPAGPGNAPAPGSVPGGPSMPGPMGPGPMMGGPGAPGSGGPTPPPNVMNAVHPANRPMQGPPRIPVPQGPRPQMRPPMPMAPRPGGIGPVPVPPRPQLSGPPNRTGPMSMPTSPHMAPPASAGQPPTGPLRLAPGVAKAPGQAQQPIQAPSRFAPPGGVGRPGVSSMLQGAAGLPGTPVTLNPAIEAANKAVEAPTIHVPGLPTPVGGNAGRKRKRGKRG